MGEPLESDGVIFLRCMHFTGNKLALSIRCVAALSGRLFYRGLKDTFPAQWCKKEGDEMKTRFPALAAAALLSLGACTTEQVTENTGDAVLGAGRLAVNTAVGATKLVYRGARGTYRAVRDARSPDGEPFPPGTFLCTVDDGVFVEAERLPDGTYSCDHVTG
ncbi:MAG: hypothetical protein ACQEUH_11195 [Pseudomonadota bacterium]